MEIAGKDFRAMVQRIASGLYGDSAKSIGNCLKLRGTGGYQSRRRNPDEHLAPEHFAESDKYFGSDLNGTANRKSFVVVFLDRPERVFQEMRVCGPSTPLYYLRRTWKLRT